VDGECALKPALAPCREITQGVADYLRDCWGQGSKAFVRPEIAACSSRSRNRAWVRMATASALWI